MIFVHFKRTFPTRAMEWLLSCMLLSWGLMLLRPEVSFSTVSYDGLARIADEHTWGVVATAAATVRIVALTINGMWTPTYHFRSAMAFIACFVWFQISLGFFVSGNANTGAAIYPWLLLADIINTYRTARDYRAAKDARG